MKKRSRISLLLMAAAVVGLSGCIAWSNGKRQREMRKLSVRSFERIEIAGNFDVVYEQGPEHKVWVEGTKRQLDALEVKNDGTTLSLGMKKLRLDGLGGSIAISIASPDLVSVGLSGNGDFETRGKIDTDVMRVRLTGNGDMTINSLICDELFVELTGNGDIEVKNLIAGSTHLQLTGNGDIEVNGRTRSLEQQKMGNGDIDIERLSVTK
jgi:hypothetical protein